MNEKLPCWNCGVALPDVPPQGVYCEYCGNYNGPLNPTVPIVPLIDFDAPILPFPDGSKITVEAGPVAGEPGRWPVSWDAIVHGCEACAVGIKLATMEATVTANGIALRIRESGYETVLAEVRLTNEFLLALFPLLFQTMSAEQLQEVAELFTEFE